MDLLMRGMEMPKSCYTCDFCNDINEDIEGTKSSYVCSLTGSIVHDYANGKASNLTNKRQRLSCCPLVEVKPHGELISRQDVIEVLKVACEEGCNDNYTNSVRRAIFDEVLEVVEDKEILPTVLEASNGTGS